ncbi:amino acid ABC transporter substrate-binding protein [Ferruginivarius sediminum]|uniref:Amino acid ABC transporter substrate-binding protein n=1 Tax=Ferruginivarius sediminum TaxID=2661937 RepID=A0A369TEU9_9PROT|nr:amino acid ABC transporter substrate-binding protein [Ferruginivarius sediminum]RDD63891.1 amino acid ABC transporter substrate-binding protein [Ferruginivarius sediminum]
MRRTKWFAAATVAAFVGAAGVAQAGDTFDSVMERGTVRCGVNTGLAGFSIADDQGNWTGLDVDYCRAVAAAVVGDSDKVEFVPLSAQQRFTALQSGEVDVLSRNTTWTLTRDVSLGIHFAGINFYDGQGFMVPADLGVDSAKQLDGAEVCVQTGTTTELNLADYFRAQNMSFKPVVFEGFEESLSAFFAGRCQVYTTDKSGLAAIKSVDAPNPDDYKILPETISKEPLGPSVRRGDDAWFAIAKWVLIALVQAEESGITSDNIDDMKANSDNPMVKRVLGASGDMGEKLGLDPEWAYRAIKQMGNYGEMYDRNVGMESPLGLDRGLNAQWTDGGLMYAPPIR